MVLAFGIMVLYSKGYFDFTFIDRPSSNNTGNGTVRQEIVGTPTEEETAYNEEYFGKQFGEIFEEEYGDMEYPDGYIPDEFNFG